MDDTQNETPTPNEGTTPAEEAPATPESNESQTENSATSEPAESEDTEELVVEPSDKCPNCKGGLVDQNTMCLDCNGTGKI